jgi:hypothetical protein
MAGVAALVLALAGPALAGGGGGISCGLPPEEVGKCVALIGGLAEIRIRNLDGGTLLGAQFTLAPVPGPILGSPTIPYPTVLDPLFTPESVKATGVVGVSFAFNTPVSALVGSVPTLVTDNSGLAWVFSGFGDVGDEFIFRLDADLIGIGGISQLFPGMDVVLDLGLGAGNPLLTFPIADFDGFGIGTYHETRTGGGFAIDVCGGTLLVLRDGTHVFSCGSPFATPLPPALALLGLGVGLGVWRVRRRRR